MWVGAFVGVLALAPLGWSTASAAADAPATGAIVMTGGDLTNSWVVDESDHDVTVDGRPTWVQVQASPREGGSISSVWFSTTDESEPVPTAGQHPVSASGPLRLMVDEGGVGACDVEGTVDVLDLVLDGDGVPTSVALNWSGSCFKAVSGQVRAASPVPYGGIDVEHRLSWAGVLVGEPNEPQQLVVTGHGPVAASIATAGLVTEPGVAPDFVERYGTNTCTGATLGNLESCSVTIVPAPRSVSLNDKEMPFRVTTAGGGSSTTTLGYSTAYISQRGQFSPITGRVMDTRRGTGVRKGAVGPGQSVTLKVAGRSAVPATGTAAAVFNLTVTGSTRAGYVTAYPAGAARPTASSINFPAGWTGANLVTVPLGSNGSVTFFNNAGSVQLVADLVGVYADGVAYDRPGADYFPHDPTRIFDSRRDWGERLGPNEYFALRADYGSTLNQRVAAIVVNLTSTGTTGTGYLSATPLEPLYAAPSTSTLNYTRGLTSANMAVVPRAVATSTELLVPTVWIANTGNAGTHVVVDVVGYMAEEATGDTGLRFHALPPTRVVDTRKDLGLASIGSGTIKRVQAPRSVAGRDTWALVTNLTGVAPSSSTYLTAWDAGTRPTASNLNLMKGVTRANSAWPGVDTGNGFRLHNSTGSVDVVTDVTGSFELFPASLDTFAGVPFPPLGSPAATASGTREAAPPGVEVSGPKADRTVPVVGTWAR